MLYKGSDLTEPDADVAEALMGFVLGDTAATGLLPAQRRHLFGQCIDINLFSWLIATASPRTTPIPPVLSLAARHTVPKEQAGCCRSLRPKRRAVGKGPLVCRGTVCTPWMPHPVHTRHRKMIMAPP